MGPASFEYILYSLLTIGVTLVLKSFTGKTYED